MPGCARSTDIAVGVCICHAAPIPMVGVIVSSSGNSTSNGLGKARVTDIVIGGCGDVGLIVTGSGLCTSNGLGVARAGDMVVGCLNGTIVSSSGNFITA